MSTLKIGWIGSGFVGQVGHLNLYEDISIANIVALSELRKNLATRVQKKHDIKKVVRLLQQITFSFIFSLFSPCFITSNGKLYKKNRARKWE